ncbi:MAG: YfhO family protein, partial [Clostridium sp.]|nr:YfhO family protein [Clostridium sp.]
MEKSTNYEFLAGGLAFGVILLCYLLSGIVSLAGDKCILVSDLYGQYYEFLIGMRRIILEQRSLVFSWNLDMGIGIIGWIAYYVTSPFNLLLLIVPERFILAGIVVIIQLKTACCAVTFTYGCRKIFQDVGIHTVLMALGYSLGSYMVTYFLHIMWLDVVILLP